MRKEKWSRVTVGVSVGMVLCCAMLTAQTNTFPSSGNVGIGTTSPGANLDIETPVGTTTATLNFGANNAPPWGKFIVTRTDTGNNGSISFMDSYYFSHMTWGKNSIPSMVLNAAGWSGLYPTSLVLNDLSGNTQISLNTGGGTYFNGGNVGIGTIAPGQNLKQLNSSGTLVPYTTTGPVLEVSGTIALSTGQGGGILFPDGTIQSTAYVGTTCPTGGDYAESIDVTGDKHEYEPGDVMVIDPANPGQFLKSSEPYSTLVAGIYSTKPGFVGRRQTTDPKTSISEIPMAMVGIVPTKVSTENGPIKEGDLLVTSSTPGYVMKGTDRSAMTGAIVGKALAAMDSGTGVIEVLVSLQ